MEQETYLHIYYMSVVNCVGILWWQCSRVFTAGRCVWLQVTARWQQHQICSYVNAVIQLSVMWS